jgi:cytochrome c5
MARRTATLVFIVGLFCMTGCSMTQTIPEPESPGAKLYLKKCTQCHGLPAPQRHTAEQWDHLLVMMESFMGQKNLAFPEDEKKLIRGYLHRNAR